jgi:hypothetical protein
VPQSGAKFFEEFYCLVQTCVSDGIKQDGPEQLNSQPQACAFEVNRDRLLCSGVANISLESRPSR